MKKQKLNINFTFSKRTENFRGNIIRDLLKLTENPNIISLAGGLPAMETFPDQKQMLEIIKLAYKKFGKNILQYGQTGGFLPFKKSVLNFFKTKLQIKINSIDDLIIDSGSQTTLDRIAKIFINPCDKIAVESPTYLGALQAFDQYQAKYVEIATDDSGIIPSSLEKILQQYKIKFIYLIPNFQNPTGRTISLSRRKEIARIIKKYRTPLYEDDPYGLVRFSGKPLDPIWKFAPNYVIYATSFSKIFAPGFRLSAVTAPFEILNMLNSAKQGTELHTSTFIQALASVYLDNKYLDLQLPKTLALYKARKNIMVQALEKYFPSSCSWTNPQGGLFLWVTLPQKIDTLKTFKKAVEEKVAYVPGNAFFADSKKGKNTMRLNFSNQSPDKIIQGIKLLSNVFNSV